MTLRGAGLAVTSCRPSATVPVGTIFTRWLKWARLTTDVVKLRDVTTLIDCDITVNSFRDVKYAEGIVTFFPSEIQNNYGYTWTVIYATGEQKTSTEKIPQFPYTKENSITTVKVKILSNKCMKDLSKTYDSTFWKFF